MTCRITGLAPEAFAPFFQMDDATLATQSARRVVADSGCGFPCRSAFAITVRRRAGAAVSWLDQPPPVFAGCGQSPRGLAEGGELAQARLARPGGADEASRALLEDARMAYIDAHDAAAGCFAARIERHGW